MVYHALTRHFAYFFGRLNPSESFGTRAAAHYGNVKDLIESRTGPARVLSPRCFLQGSYRNETATYTINDVDVVALCALWQPGSGSGSGWDRDAIFDTIAAPLYNDLRYYNKIRYGAQSMVIKLDIEPRLEILPVVYKAGNYDFNKEPFRLYRPENAQWEDGYARYHKRLLSGKNEVGKTANNFVPAIKVFKHLRTRYSVPAVSFHVECLLYSLPNSLFRGGPADYIPDVLFEIVATSASSWYARYLPTPCGDRDIFTNEEWGRADWEAFHRAAEQWSLWANIARYATDRDVAIQYWRSLLGEDFFPRYGP
jgi:hypothetical protein